MLLKLSATPRFVSADGKAAALALRDAALLAWLALEGPTPRLRLAQLLWPESDADSARNSLRQRIHQLKKKCGVDLVLGSTTLALADGIGHDLQESDGVLGDELHGFGPELTQWLVLQRQRRRLRESQSLSELCSMAERAGDYDDALGHAQELLALQPLSEEAHRRVMRLHYLRGDRAAALLAFDRCEQVLKDEIGARPSPETLALLADVEDSAAALGPLARVLPATLLRPPRQAGREAERAALLAAWQAGQSFLLLGEPGMGKSRLLDSVAEAWPGALVVRARPGDAQVPLALAGRLVDQLCARLPSLMQLPAVKALRAVLAESSGHAGATSASRPAPLPLAASLCELLAAALADTPPLALMLDDWQFADDASVDLIGEALESPALAALRCGHASRVAAGKVAQRRIDMLAQNSTRHGVTLAPLAAEGVAEMVASLRMRGVDATSLAQTLHRRVGGNPLYLLEVLRHMHERRLPLQPEHVLAPQHVKALVMARMAELGDAARRLLRMASVAGADFSVELAEAVSGQHVLDLSDAWSSLQQLGLFDARGIAHDVYAEAVLDALPEPIGRVLHGRVAAWLEARPCEAARLAAHWRAAGDDARAVPHLLAAARQGWHAALCNEVFELYRQAAEIDAARGNADAAFEHWFTNAEAMSEVGTPALLARCLDAMKLLASHEGHHLRVRFIQMVLEWLGSGSPERVDPIARLLGDAIALGDVRVEGECRFALAHHAVGEGRFDDALAQLAAGERVLRDGGDTRRAASLAASMAMVQGLRGQPRLALREQRLLLPVLQKEGDLATWTVLRASSALQHARRGEVGAALSAVQEALASARRGSIAPPDTLVTWRYLVDALRWAGSFALALEVCDEFAARLQRQGVPARGQATTASLYLHLGRADLASPLLQSAQAAVQQRPRERLRIRLLLLELACHAGSTATTAWPDEALTGEDLSLAAEWVLWSGLQKESPWPASALAQVAERCERHEMQLWVPALRALVALRLLQQGDASASAWLPADGHAEALPVLLAAAPWAALYGARALALAGDARGSQASAAAGAQWLRQRAGSDLPELFRDSFLYRHPVHAALMAGPSGDAAGTVGVTHS